MDRQVRRPQDDGHLIGLESAGGIDCVLDIGIVQTIFAHHRPIVGMPGQHLPAVHFGEALRQCVPGGVGLGRMDVGALIRHGEGIYELAKMAVTASERGHGIGRRLAEASPW